MESHRFLDPRKGKRDTAAKLGRKAHVHAPTRDEDLRLCGDSRSPGRSMSALERNPQVPALTPHKVLGPTQGLQRERNPERPTSNSHGDWPFLRPPERVPEVPLVSGEHLLKLGNIQEPLHSRENCFPFTASTLKPRIDSHHRGTWESPVGKPRGNASWESLEGKPQIP